MLERSCGNAALGVKYKHIKSITRFASEICGWSCCPLFYSDWCCLTIWKSLAKRMSFECATRWENILLESCTIFLTSSYSLLKNPYVRALPLRRSFFDCHNLTKDFWQLLSSAKEFLLDKWFTCLVINI